MYIRFQYLKNYILRFWVPYNGRIKNVNKSEKSADQNRNWEKKLKLIIISLKNLFYHINKRIN